MATFSSFLPLFNSDGILFEKFVKWFLTNDPEWSTQVKKVWLWDDWPGNWGPDCGVDLIFEHRNGETWAVQAKCYAPQYSITKHDVDKFLSESNRPSIDKRLLIASTDLIGKNAKQVCDAQEKPVTRFLYSDFDRAALEYPEDISKLESGTRKALPEPRPHQKEAIIDVVKGFQSAARGQLIMACGTGKTFTTLWIKEELSAQSTLVLLPSLSLLSQTLREWTAAKNTDFNVLCVCSDQTVGKIAGDDQAIFSVKDFSFPVVSDGDAIKVFLKAKGNKVIFSTYQSSPLIEEAQKDIKVAPFELVIADEAHRCAGKVGSSFTTVLDQSLIRANKRLFTTATPRTYSTALKKRGSQAGVEVIGMDNEATFGKVFHSLSFGQAIKQKLLTDYQVVIIAVDDPMIAQWIERREILETGDGTSIDAGSLASQIGLIKAIKDYDLKRIISFHSRVKRAENFASEILDTINIIDDSHRPDGVLKTEHVSGIMPSSKRRTRLLRLKELDDAERRLLSNAQCLSEGVDVPALDGVAFIDPRASKIGIVQAVGRAIRLNEEKTVGTIVLPVFIENGDDIEESIDSSNFKHVWEVLNALKSHDEELSFELESYRTEMGRNPASQPRDFTKIIFDIPTAIDKSFSESLKTFLVEKTTSSWSFMFGLLQAYCDREGHSRVPKRTKVTHNGVSFNTGAWVSKQRRNKETMSEERRLRLGLLPGWAWNKLDALWEDNFAALEFHASQDGNNARVPQNTKITHNGVSFNTGSWVSKQRTNKETMSEERRLRLGLLPGWEWDTRK